MVQLKFSHPCQFGNECVTRPVSVQSSNRSAVGAGPRKTGLTDIVTDISNRIAIELDNPTGRQQLGELDFPAIVVRRLTVASCVAVENESHCGFE